MSINYRGVFVAEWCEQFGLVPNNSEGRFILERLFGTSEVDNLLCHFLTREIKCSRILNLDFGSVHRYIWSSSIHSAVADREA